MPFPSQHYLLAFGGPLFGIEEWSCGLRSTPDFAEGNQETLEAVLADLTVVLEAWMASGPIASVASLGWVKYNRITVEGRYANDYTGVEEVIPPVVGQVAGTILPPQVSLVATLETGVTRGLAHRGRIFLPAPRFAVATDGRISAANATTAAASVAGLITNLNAVAGYGTTSVYSSTRAGATRPVTGVTVGRVYDTVRTRRAQLPEERPVASPVTGL